MRRMMTEAPDAEDTAHEVRAAVMENLPPGDADIPDNLISRASAARHSYDLPPHAHVPDVD